MLRTLQFYSFTNSSCLAKPDEGRSPSDASHHSPHRGAGLPPGPPQIGRLERSSISSYHFHIGWNQPTFSLPSRLASPGREGFWGLIPRWLNAITGALARSELASQLFAELPPLPRCRNKFRQIATGWLRHRIIFFLPKGRRSLPTLASPAPVGGDVTALTRSGPPTGVLRSFAFLSRELKLPPCVFRLFEAMQSFALQALGGATPPPLASTPQFTR